MRYSGLLIKKFLPSFAAYNTHFRDSGGGCIVNTIIPDGITLVDWLCTEVGMITTGCKLYGLFSMVYTRVIKPGATTQVLSQLKKLTVEHSLVGFLMISPACHQSPQLLRRLLLILMPTRMNA